MRPIFVIDNKNQTGNTLATLISQKMDFSVVTIDANELENIEVQIEQDDAALLIIGINSNKEIQFYLNKCREIRVPYFFVKNNLPLNFNINTIILPITNLEEEKEKAPFTSSFARHFNSEIKIFQPNDYGSKAAIHIESVKQLFDKFNLNHTTIKGKKDSSNIEFESGIINNDANNTILIISASRDYGLDDIIFGPKEKKILKNINIPVMLINPRGDLYALCD